MKRICFTLFFCLSACARDIPDVSTTISAAALNRPAPVLIPIEGLLDQARTGSQVEAATASLQARAAALERKAAALRGQSIEAGQQRLRALKNR